MLKQVLEMLKASSKRDYSLDRKNKKYAEGAIDCLNDQLNRAQCKALRVKIQGRLNSWKETLASL